MKMSELLNHRTSYQVLITFDLTGAETSKYRKLRDTLAEELELETYIHMSKDEGGNPSELPCNTLAALWAKDASEQETRNYFQKVILTAFKNHHLHGRYVILVAQNWAVAADEF